MKAKHKPNPVVKDLRKCAGVTLREAAKAAGVAASTILLVERGHAHLTERQAELLGRLYAKRLTERNRLLEELSAVA
jgi:transcriptional regulator with XRE-family HTH domain